jgi:glycosyltransferase involved in cell wall biosynthesis
MRAPLQCAIAIPARNEADLITRCLASIAAQTVEPARFVTVVLANNCCDDTADKARNFRGLPNLIVEEVCFAPEAAHAGAARRAVVDMAALLSNIVLTTDADCVADPDWVEAMLDAFARGADAVAGAVSGDWEELRLQPPEALAIGKLEWDYLALMAEAESVFDPREHDPWPRHAQNYGANLGITRQMLETVDGIPSIATGEDRALIATVESAGGKVRHDPRPHVTASARTAGRASGGMADALATRISHDYLCGDEFEPANDLVARLKRRRLERSFAHIGDPIDRTMPPRRRLKPTELQQEIDRLRTLIEAAQ